MGVKIMALENQVYGYARVSTHGQSLDRQIDNITAAGVEDCLIFREKISGTKKKQTRTE
jgi:DNA invertase Pin-like site-specific DNA recombinase